MKMQKVAAAVPATGSVTFASEENDRKIPSKRHRRWGQRRLPKKVFAGLTTFADVSVKIV